MTELHFMPYVPGRARGVLRRGLSAAASDAILAVSQAELRALPGLPAAGLIVMDGAPLSHAAIRLLGMGIPVVMATAAQLAGLPDGTEIVVDGERGTIGLAGEDGETTMMPPPIPAAGRAVETADGAAVELRASIADAAGAARAVTKGAAAVGLVRSEFLWTEDGRLPEADYYERAFAALCEAARALPVTVRLLDIAADKRPPWLAGVAGIEGPLGRYGPRLYAVEPVKSVLHAQLQAIDRLAQRFDLRVLVPNVSSTDEAKYLREEIARSLPITLPIGMMAETPAAALSLTSWPVDFLALGCNDLMQCLFGADRDDPLLSVYLDPFAPVLFRFLREVAESAGPRRGEIQVCGLLPQIPGVLPVLLGLGFRVFSVEPIVIPYLARSAGGTETGRAAALAASVCEAASSSEVRMLLELAPDAGKRTTD
jgi:phosphoenolpyruvate-protein kinase (PTS system EI component)